MSWEPPLQDEPSRLPAPADGIVASARPGGWIAVHWAGLLADLGAAHQSRLARGRTIARGGRVRGLWFAPGVAQAEVVTSDANQVSVRVRDFGDDEWATVRAALLEDLDAIALLLGGELDAGLVARLAKQGVRILPNRDEVEIDCDCTDFTSPCAHAAAVHNVLGDALDGEPFLLLTLRGRPRDVLLAELRAAWGDPRPMRSADSAIDDAAPAVDDWYGLNTPFPALSFAIRPADISAAGLRALGPPQVAEVVKAVEPLYIAGASAAIEAAMREIPQPDPSAFEASPAGAPPGRRPPEAVRRAIPVAPRRPHPTESEEETPMARKSKRVKVEHTPELTERIVNALAEIGSAKSTDLAEVVGVDHLAIREELVTLEKIGVVYRTGRTRGTYWWLG